jgi:ribosomal protein S18 acetylase RimI-like enzyme
MATLTETTRSIRASGHIRPLQAYRDMAAVADLVELCFSDTLDAEGRRYIQNMRTVSAAPGYLYFTSLAEGFNSLPVAGYVWEEAGRIIGNLSLIPQRIHRQKAYLIANVAVHPSYRRRGIGKALTQEGIDHSRRHGAASVWLQVREENGPAIHLYESLGFEERARRTTWYSSSSFSSANKAAADGNSAGTASSPEIQIRPVSPAVWPKQLDWLKRNYPREIDWQTPFKAELLQPGWKGWLQCLLKGVIVQQWAAWKEELLIGVLSNQTTLTTNNLLWLAADPEQEEQAALALLHHLRQVSGKRGSFVFDYPSHRADQAIQSAGFYSHQNLIWMEIKFHR